MGVGWRRGKADEVVFVSYVSTKVSKVQICLKTFVHDCSYVYSVNNYTQHVLAV